MGRSITFCKGGFELRNGYWNDSRFYLEPETVEGCREGMLLCAKSVDFEREAFKWQASRYKSILKPEYSDEGLLDLAQSFGFLIPHVDWKLNGGTGLHPVIAVPLSQLREKLKELSRCLWIFEQMKLGIDAFNEYIVAGGYEDTFYLSFPDHIRFGSDMVLLREKEERLVQQLPYRALVNSLNRGISASMRIRFEWDEASSSPQLVNAGTEELLPILWEDLYRRVMRTERKACVDCGVPIYAERKSKKRCNACRYAKADKKKVGRRGTKG